MTFERLLLAACVAAELAALGLAVVVAVRGSLIRGAARETVAAPHHKGARWFSAIAGHGSPLDRGLRFFRRAARSPLVRLLALAVVVDVAVAVLVVEAGRGPVRVGWPRVAYHAADALVMAWPLGVAWACRAVFAATKGERPELERGPSRSASPRCASSRGPAADAALDSPAFGASQRDGQNTVHRASEHVNGSASTLPAIVPGAWIGCTVSLILAHPLSRTFTARTLHAFELLCVATTWLAIRRGWRARWGVEHRALVVLAFFETVVATVGPFAGDVFASWPVVGCGLYLAAFASVAGVLGWELRDARRARP